MISSKDNSLNQLNAKLLSYKTFLIISQLHHNIFWNTKLCWCKFRPLLCDTEVPRVVISITTRQAEQTLTFPNLKQNVKSEGVSGGVCKGAYPTPAC